MNSLNLVKCRVDLRFRADELSECDVRQCVLNDLVKSNNDRSNSAVSLVNAAIQYAGVALAVMIDLVLFQNFDDFTEFDLGRHARQTITAFCATDRGNKSRLVEQPHQFSRIGDGDAFPFSDLRKRQTFVFAERCELQQATQSIFFLC